MSGFLRLPHHRGGVVGINPSVCVLFMTQHLLHSLFSSSFSLTLTRCSSIAIIIPAYPIFFLQWCQVYTRWDIQHSSLSLSIWHSLFPFSSLFLSASYPSSKAYIMFLRFVKGDDNDSHVEYSHHAVTALCSAEKSHRAVVENSRECRYDREGCTGLRCVLLMGLFTQSPTFPFVVFSLVWNICENMWYINKLHTRGMWWWPTKLSGEWVLNKE